MLTPVFGLLLGAVLLAEPVTARLLFALATVAAGIFLVNRRDAMTRILVTIALRLAVCTGISWAVWRWLRAGEHGADAGPRSASCWPGRCSTSRARCATA